MDIFTVEISKEAKKDLENIENDGLRSVRKISGYHDEPLKGKRIGQRSIRLSISYRAIYILDKNKHIEIVKIIEVNKHDY